MDTEVRYVDANGEAVTTSLRELDLERASTALPVRRLKSHARQRHYSGRFWSATTGGHVPYESRLELDRHPCLGRRSALGVGGPNSPRLRPMNS